MSLHFNLNINIELSYDNLKEIIELFQKQNYLRFPEFRKLENDFYVYISTNTQTINVCSNEY